MKLYELTNELRSLEAEFEQNEGEVQNANLVKLEQVSTNFNEKITNIARLVKNLEAEANAIREEEKRLAKKRRSKEKQIEWLKDYIKNAMLQTETSSVKDAIISVSIRNTQPKLVITNENAIKDERFIRIKREINKSALKDAIKSGEEIEGVSLEENKALFIK